MIADLILNHLSKEQEESRYFSRRDLLYGKATKYIIEPIKEAVTSFHRVRDINSGMDYLLDAGMLKEVPVRVVRTGPEKQILQVITTVS